jgi:hypothetical protein
MTTFTHVTFKGLAPRTDVEALVQQEVASLARHYDRIVDCRVRLEVPHRHHTSGNAVQVLIELTVPGDRLVVDHACELQREADGAGNGSLYSAVRAAFAVAQRQLAAFADRSRQERHARPAKLPA